MTELLLAALLPSGVAVCFIVALWLGNLLDADEWDGGDE